MTTKSEGMMIPGKLKWYAILALALWLAFSGVAAAEQLYVNESGWWHAAGAFNASGTPISAAVGAAGERDAIFVHGGNYYENVDVDKPRLTLRGAGMDVVTVTAAYPGDHVFEVSADYVNVSGFTVTGAQWQMGIFPSGIYIGSGTDHCNISNNNASNNCYAIHLHNSNSNILFNNAISNNYYGIYLQESGSNTLANNSCSTSYHGINTLDSGNNTLTNNTADSNAKDGIHLEASSNNTLSDNTVMNNRRGIYMEHSGSNTLTDNAISENKYNFGVDGRNLSDYIQNVHPSNTVDGKPIYYWVDQKDKTIPDDAGFVGAVNSTNITARDLMLINNSEGVLFAYTKNSMIENVSTSNNYYYGIYLSSSSNNTLTNNTANLNIEDGICLRDSSNNTLTNNIATDARYGISLYHSSNNTLTSNICSSNSRGICLRHSSNNTLSNNTANSNDNYLMDRCFGILLDSSSNNSLVNNTANSNKYCGIGLYSSSDNEITCNLVQNNIQEGFHLSDSFYARCINNIISHNNIIENGNYNTTTGGWEWQFYIAQYQPIEAKHNYWGAGMNNTTIDASIYYCNEFSYLGKVEFYPFETEPVPCAPTPEESPAFTTADAVIALQIAAGSRPPDLHWDVSGDGSVTSLDALMIMQAAADAIDL